LVSGNPESLQGEAESALKEDGKEATRHPENEGSEASFLHGVPGLGDEEWKKVFE
jgi:hypothetical protein